MKKQSGFAGLELIVVVFVIAAVVFVGYYVIHGNNVASKASPIATNTTSTPVSPPVTTATAPQITNASDLNSALQAINSTSVSSNNTDSNTLTAQSQGF